MMAAAALPMAVSESGIRLRGLADRNMRLARIGGDEVIVCSVGFEVSDIDFEESNVGFEASVVDFQASSVDEWELYHGL